MDTEDMEIDPAVAEAMGFAGFGMQNKKRKIGTEDAFVGTESDQASKPPTTGSSNVKPGNTAGRLPVRPTTQSNTQTAARETVGPDGKPTLEALRHGVRNAQGDMAYFLPSFIEDPWKDLKPR